LWVSHALAAAICAVLIAITINVLRSSPFFACDRDVTQRTFFVCCVLCGVVLCCVVLCVMVLLCTALFLPPNHTHKPHTNQLPNQPPKQYTFTPSAHTLSGVCPAPSATDFSASGFSPEPTNNDLGCCAWITAEAGSGGGGTCCTQSACDNKMVLCFALLCSLHFTSLHSSLSSLFSSSTSASLFFELSLCCAALPLHCIGFLFVWCLHSTGGRAGRCVMSGSIGTTLLFGVSSQCRSLCVELLQYHCMGQTNDPIGAREWCSNTLTVCRRAFISIVVCCCARRLSSSPIACYR
jgi:hypothetical protein